MKYKGYKIVKKPKLIKFWGFRGAVLFNLIILRADIFDRFKSNNRDPEVLSVLEHEIEHIKRADRIGVLKTNLLYWSSKNFRFQHELASIEKEMKILKKNNLDFNIKKRARDLSDRHYLWSVNYQEAKKKLNSIWNGI